MRPHSFLKIILPFVLTSSFLPVYAFPAKNAVTQVTAITVKPQHWQPHINAVGTLVAEHGVVMKSEVPGRITAIHFTSGQSVEKGALLMELNPDILSGQLESAKAALKLSQLDFERTKDLLKKNNVSRSEYDKAAANLQSSKGEYEKAQAQLNQSLIRAPFSGTLGLRLVSEGDYVVAGQKLVNLQQFDPMLVDFSIPEIYMDDLAVGQTVNITPDTTSKSVYVGKVRALDSQVDPVTRLLAVRAEVPNKAHKLVPGAFADIDVFLATGKPAIMLPKIAVLYDSTGSYVFTVNKGKAQKVSVSLGTILDHDIIITKGVAAGDVVVTTGQDKLHTGSMVVTAATKAS